MVHVFTSYTLKARLYNFINDAKLYNFSGSQKFFFDSRENVRTLFALRRIASSVIYTDTEIF